MVQINMAQKQVSCKLVYYGPGLSGKTTNIEMVHEKAPEKARGELTSIATEGDRTLFFDFMPLNLGNVAGMNTRFQLYTVPGQVYYNSTRKLVLQGVDGLVFVADSSPDKRDENIESFQNMVENLKEYGRDIREIPFVLQFNKRDLSNAMSISEMQRDLNSLGAPAFEAVAKTGDGVFPTLKALAGLVLKRFSDEIKGTGSARPGTAPRRAIPPHAATDAVDRGPAEAAARPGTDAVGRRAPDAVARVGTDAVGRRGTEAVGRRATDAMPRRGTDALTRRGTDSVAPGTDRVPPPPAGLPYPPGTGPGAGGMSPWGAPAKAARRNWGMIAMIGLAGVALAIALMVALGIF